DQAAFEEAVERARALAEQGWLTTFGLVPTQPETGFGYIEKGQALDAHGYRVERFVEKPNAETAQRYVEGGQHLWNAGMFCMRADAILRELQQHAPQVLDAVGECLGLSQSKQGSNSLQLELDATSFAQVADIRSEER
uniref:NTP_transferase domain-containing protein n=1 Tax=Steinernema glaseri TaxID=37863 RepID=A0A1I7Y3F1_9BILA